MILPRRLSSPASLTHRLGLSPADIRATIAAVEKKVVHPSGPGPRGPRGPASSRRGRCPRLRLALFDFRQEELDFLAKKSEFLSIDKGRASSRPKTRATGSTSSPRARSSSFRPRTARCWPNSSRGTPSGNWSCSPASGTTPEPVPSFLRSSSPFLRRREPPGRPFREARAGGAHPSLLSPRHRGADAQVQRPGQGEFALGAGAQAPGLRGQAHGSPQQGLSWRKTCPNP